MIEGFVRPSKVLELFAAVKAIPGFFNYDDAQHFALILRMQEALGLKGDILEIGTWKGRSAAFLGCFLREGERLILNDVFSAPATDKYPEYPSPQEVRDAVLRFSPDIASSLLFIEGNCRSSRLPADAKLRFAHVDGGHSFDECYADLKQVAQFVVPGGVIAVDDYDHPDWPEVKPAMDRWLAESGGFGTLIDMNRAGAKGKKSYAICLSI